MDDWVPHCFNVTERQPSHLHGWVSTERDLEEVLEAHRRISCTTFVSWSDDAKKKQKKERRLLWTFGNEATVCPYTVDRSVVYTCTYGKGRKPTEHGDLPEPDHQYVKKKRFLIQKSRKVNCRAKLLVRYVTRFGDYSIAVTSGKKKRKQKLTELCQDLDNSTLSIEKKKSIFIKLPLCEAHTNHKISIESVFSKTMHHELKEQVKLHVSMGMTSTPVVKRLLRQYVKDMSHPDMVMPSDSDRSYYPTNTDIANCIHAALVAGQYSGLDQENLAKKIEEWESLKPHDKFFLRPCTGEKANSNRTVKRSDRVFNENESDDEGDMEEEEGKQTFLWIHQTAQQQQLLKKYGDMVLLDATYKTTKYALPLFLVAVRTNVSYVPVCEFIPESESVDNVAEALEILKQWNGDWVPKYFMIDYSDLEYQALHHVFPESSKYLCIFHAEQSWLRWTRQKEKHNITDKDRDDLLCSLRQIARATSKDVFQDRLADLKESTVYMNNPKVRTYLDRYWLNIPERWCRAFFEEGFHVNVTTNNGIEALNNSLKTFYTKLTSMGTLTSLVDILVNEFVPEQLRTYIRLNYQYSGQYKQYNECIPQYLHNKPRTVVKHCLHRYASAESYTENDINYVSDGIFLVKSASDPQTFYNVDLGSSERSPFCSCPDFVSTHLPCKHMFGVFRNTESSWHNLSPMYLASPYLKLDDQFLSNAALEVSQLQDQSDTLHFIETNESIHHEKDVESEVVKGRKMLRENLKILDDLTFLTKEADALVEINSKVVEMINVLKKTVNYDDHLPLHQGETARQNSRQLPNRKRKKPTKAAAAKKRRLQSDPNVDGIEVKAACPTVKNTGKGSNSTKEIQRKLIVVDGAFVAIDEDPEDTDQTCAEACRQPLESAKETQNPNTSIVDGALAIDQDPKHTETCRQPLELSKETQNPNTSNSYEDGCPIGPISSLLPENYHRLFDRGMLKSYIVSNTADANKFQKTVGDADIPVITHNKSTSIYPLLQDNLTERGKDAVQAINNPWLINTLVDWVSSFEQFLSSKPLSSSDDKSTASIVPDAEEGVKKHSTTHAEKQQGQKKRKVRFSQTSKKDIDEKLSPRPYGGLRNTGGENLCFANSILQCLRLTDIRLILSRHDQCVSDAGCFVCVLRDFFEDGDVSASALCGGMKSFWPEYSIGTQEDAHEFYQKVMGHMLEMMPRDHLFSGDLLFTVLCPNCSQTYTNTESFLCLSVPIKNTITVTQALSNFFAPVKHKGFHCRSCLKDVTAQGKVSLLTLPKFMVVQLKRFSNNGAKDRRQLDIEEEIRLRVYVKPGEVLADKFRLIGVVMHDGTQKNGHYRCFTLHGMQWFEINDMRISPVPVRSVKEDQAYMLFYKALPRPYIN